MTAYVPYQAKKCKFFVNGDTRFFGKHCIVNPKKTRDFDSFLEDLTNNLKTTRPIRNICTPVGGHKITSISDLQHNGAYVASYIPSEKFKNIGYLQMAPDPEATRAFYQNPRDFPVSTNVAAQYIKPVEHNKHYRCSGRIRKIPTNVITIFVFRNGLESTPPARITITHQMLRYGWDCVYQDIQSRLRSKMNGAPKKLLMMNGSPVPEVGDLKNMENYVLVCNGDIQGFRKVDYGRAPVPFQSSHFATRKHYQTVYLNWKSSFQTPEGRRPRRLEPISKQRRSRKDDSDNDSNPTSTGSSNKTVKSVKTPKSFKSNKSVKPLKPVQPPNKPKKEMEPVFHAKPVKLKRTAEVPPPKLQAAESGVFKSKQPAITAVEIQETTATKVELPIDQRQAEEVTEEEIVEEEESKLALVSKTKSPSISARSSILRMQSSRSPRSRIQTPEKKPDPKHDAAATKIQAGVRGHLARKEVAQKKEDKQLRDAAAAEALENSAKEYEETKAQAAKEAEQDKAATKIQANYRGYKDRKRVKTLREDNTKEDSQAKAAATIQANYLGYSDRKKVKMALKTQKAEAKASKDESEHLKDEQESILLVDEPPQAEHDKDDQVKAATKIQSSFRGYSDRKKVKALKQKKAEQRKDSTPSPVYSSRADSPVPVKDIPHLDKVEETKLQEPEVKDDIGSNDRKTDNNVNEEQNKQEDSPPELDELNKEQKLNNEKSKVKKRDENNEASNELEEEVLKDIKKDVNEKEPEEREDNEIELDEKEHNKNQGDENDPEENMEDISGKKTPTDDNSENRKENVE